MYISSGVTSTGVLFDGNDEDWSVVEHGGMVIDAAIKTDCHLNVYGTAKKVTVSSGASMTVWSGGTATEILWTPCEGHVRIDGGYATFASKYSGVYIGSDNKLLSNTPKVESKTLLAKEYERMCVMSGGKANANDLFGCYMGVFSGGTANSNTIGEIANSNTIYYGELDVFSGGIANYTRLDNGFLEIFNGGTASKSIVNGGMMRIYGGKANGITVTSKGYLEIFDGSATNIVWTPCEGKVSIRGNAYVTFASKYSGVYVGYNNQLIFHEKSVDYEFLNNGQQICVMSGGIANNTTINSFDEQDYFASLDIYSGGKANNTSVHSGRLIVYSSGTAFNTIVSGVNGESYTELKISYGGVASKTIVTEGSIYIDGIANNTTVSSGGSVTVWEDGIATDTTVYPN